jgi:hypothetical protein
MRADPCLDIEDVDSLWSHDHANWLLRLLHFLVYYKKKEKKNQKNIEKEASLIITVSC